MRWHRAIVKRPLNLRETSPRTASTRRDVCRPDPAPRAGEPALGSSTDRRRAQEARPLSVGDLCPQPLTAPRPSAAATAKSHHVARLPAPTSGEPRRLRLLHRRDGVPSTDLCQVRQPHLRTEPAFGDEDGSTRSSAAQRESDVPA
jgi:hypothetical protein